jgi:hypothetical protein
MRISTGLCGGLLASLLLTGTVAQAAPPTATSASADAWAERMPPTAVVSYLRETDTKVLVVTAGETSAELAAVGKATMTALRNTGRFDLIMDSSGLGKVGDLGDQEIVKKAAGSPVTAVMIVRVFGEGAQASVVGTAYTLEGSVISAFSLSPGATLSIRVEASAGSGLSESAVGAVSEVMHDNSGDSSSGKKRKLEPAELEYLDRFLHFRYMVSINVYTGQGTAYRTTQVLRGIDNIPLSDVEMLHYIGEEELADRHRARQATKAGLMISGGILGFGPLIGGAVLVGIINNEDCTDIAPLLNCDQHVKFRPAGVGLLVVGSIFTSGFIVGAALPVLVNNSKKTELMNRYNQKLRRELLLPDDVEDRLLSSNDRDRDRRRARMLATWRLTPTVAGLSFNGRF